MLYWSVVFLIVSFVAGIFGFGGLSATSAGIAQTLFYIFMVLFVVSIILHLVTGRRRPLM